MESTESEQQLDYNDNDHLPVFRNGLTCGLSTKEIVTTLKTLDVNDKCVAKVVPAPVSHNVAFVLDVTSKFVGHLKNVLSDDMGAWNQTGTKTVYFKCKSGSIEEVTNFWKDEENVFKVVKWYYRNNSSKRSLLYEYRDLFIDMVVRNNRSELAIANRHQER